MFDPLVPFQSILPCYPVNMFEMTMDTLNPLLEEASIKLNSAEIHCLLLFFA